MKKIYRQKQTLNYWNNRWKDSGVDNATFQNTNIYPIKYANLIINNKDDHILEAGCGAGRLLFHYMREGYNIAGIDYSEEAINAIKNKDAKANVFQASITELPFADSTFDKTLAFGLYHNFEDLKIIQQAIKETARVMRSQGEIMASFRYDCFENELNEKILDFQKNIKREEFHKMHFSRDDLKSLFKEDFDIIEIHYARNVSFLFKLNFLRIKSMKKQSFIESEARSSGFKLNVIGSLTDKILHGLFPSLFSSLLIVHARKKDYKNV